MTESEARSVLGALKAAYPRQPISIETLKVYERFLCDMDAEAVVEAMRAHIQTSRFFPTIAEVREMALGTERVQPAELAWADVLAEIRRTGIYGQPRFTNPITAAAVSAVGWQAICNSEFIASERRCFIDAYEVSSEKQKHAMLTGGTPCTPALEGPRGGGPVSLGAAISGLLPEQDDDDQQRDT